ncbi:Phage shock protein A (IM30), suppresses sigma54-dependent transcription [Candidatus Paraburkholderia kirkii]|nr:Phage shock protein A (IM30), suppresses sigma54-dependent transcription [Candidatus Paraburkholderia kirkii]
MSTRASVHAAVFIQEKYMSLFDSITRTVKGLLNDAADTMQDPSRDARQIVRELDDSIAKAENSLIEIEAQVATQQSKRDAAAEKARKYEDGAKRALQAGDEGLAREALAAQANAETERDALAVELQTLEPSVEHLKTQIADMRQRRNDLNARSNILQAKQQIAQAKDTAATALGGIGGKNLSEDFQKLEDKIQLANARSDARLNSADQKSGKALEDKLAAFNRGPSVEDRLEALKKQLNTPAQ